eukprot:SAG31_NODE_944_length_10844_cov_11.214053_13_plen_145_part_00
MLVIATNVLSCTTLNMIVVPHNGAVWPTVCITLETGESAGIRDIKIACTGIVAAKAPPTCRTSTTMISGVRVQSMSAGATKQSNANAMKMQKEPLCGPSPALAEVLVLHFWFSSSSPFYHGRVEFLKRVQPSRHAYMYPAAPAL